MINQQRLINTFLELIQIDSESGNEATIRTVLIKKLSKLGLEFTTDKTGNLHGNLPGKIKGKALLFSAHMDTVKPGCGVKPVIKADKITSRGNTILGADDKSGIAVILEMLEIIKENKILTVPIKVLFTVSEEVGLKGSSTLKKNSINADYGFIMDTNGPIGTIITSAPSNDTFTAIVQGKAAHAGIEPEKGVNAIVAASKAISKMKLGRIDSETTANISIIEGGKAINIVPQEVTIQGEARSRNEQKLIKQITHMKTTFETECSKMGAKVKFINTREYDAFNITPRHELVKLCQKAAAGINIKAIVKSTGGGSDANHLNHLGIPAVVLSTGMAKVHTTDEFIKIPDMFKAAEFILAIAKLQNEFSN
ncbi:MAG: M20/M25/M40 family metallo-hydrolase [Candidatus Margulisiibacteriota bacterium]